MNKNDSSVIGKLLDDHGFESTTDPGSADVYIINTCTVREHAANRALAFVAGLKEWRRAGDRILAVVGCLAQNNADEITKSLKHVDLILGPDAYREIGNYITQITGTRSRIIDTKLSAETYCGIFHRPNTVADFVSIMRGCSNYCSYCVVPYVRGPARSRAFDDIRNEIAHLVEHGVRDITLLGQNVNEYHHESKSFTELLQHVAMIPGVFRIRFLTSHPKDFTRETVQVIKENNNICEWFHLPLQSGSNRILQLMNRQYTKEHYHDLVEHIRSQIPESTITTDVITGFPTETEQEFIETLNMLREIEFDDAYMYRYSIRSGTKASSMPSLDEDTIKARLAESIQVKNGIVVEKTKAMIGKVYEVLFESAARGNGSRGKTRGNKNVVVQEKIKPGEVRNVRIKEVKGQTPIGELVDA